MAYFQQGPDGGNRIGSLEGEAGVEAEVALKGLVCGLVEADRGAVLAELGVQRCLEGSVHEGVRLPGLLQGNAHLGQEVEKGFEAGILPHAQADGDKRGVVHGFVQGPVVQNAEPEGAAAANHALGG